MDKVRFTAGEWKIREFKGDSWPDNRISIGPEDDHKAIAVAISPRYAEREQMLADARLIAAAPELYDLLDEIVLSEDGMVYEALGSDYCKRLTLVLAKVRGEEK